MKLISIILILVLVSLSMQGRRGKARKNKKDDGSSPIQYVAIVATPDKTPVGASAFYKCSISGKKGCKKHRHCEWIEGNCYDKVPFNKQGKLLSGDEFGLWCGTFPPQDCATCCNVAESSNMCSLPNENNVQKKLYKKMKKI